TTLKSYTETLLAGAMEQPDICRSFLVTMEKETERMVRLVKDLLVLSQLDYRQVGWHKDYYYLNDLIKEVVNDLQIKYKEDPRQIVMSLPESPLTAYVDRDKMKQVLLNLIQNAYKYTAADGCINVTLTQQEKALLIEIADNGIGIPPDDLERVFERFYRVDKARSREYGGTGLGLPIAREIVAAHGGEIFLQSELNKGTTVTIALPLLAKEDEQCESA
ncbi:MAG: cell wall metabolism sensor histidine kinase WalK, partial [Firmicutes bacterium]|nr:cell wall metabolism sensor histidine kinase WalK [Bacillota bacterium]